MLRIFAKVSAMLFITVLLASCSLLTSLFSPSSTSQQSQVASPTFSPQPGSVTGTTAVTIGTSTAGASIFYTTDGSQPTRSNSLLYSGNPISISSTTILSAFATLSGWKDSGVATGAYVVSTNSSTAYVVRDDFSSNTTSDYNIYYRSNNDGTVGYSPGQMELNITGWNGIRVRHVTDRLFPDYCHVTFKFPSMSDSTTYFVLEIAQFGNQGAPSWPALNDMNGLNVVVRNTSVESYIRTDPNFDPNTVGQQGLDEQDPINVTANQWHDLVTSRQGTNVTIYLDGTPIRTISIPSYFETTNMSVGVGVGSHSGESGYIDYLEYDHS